MYVVSRRRIELKRKVPTTVMFDKDQLEALDGLSSQSGKSKSAIVREALSKFLTEVTLGA